MAKMKEKYLNNHEYTEDELEEMYDQWIIDQEQEMIEKGLRGA